MKNKTKTKKIISVILVITVIVSIGAVAGFNAFSVEPLGEHSYVYQYRRGARLYYKCTHCGDYSHYESAKNLRLAFEDAVTSEDNPYHQSNYDGRFDILRDGFINAKDYTLINDMASGKSTDYDKILTNENATERAKRLYRYICKTYKNKTFSGQQESTWMDSPEYEMNYLYQTPGKYPAIRGLDFINDDFNGVVQRAKAWDARGGIVTICWHCSKNFNLGYNECKADELTPAEWEAVLTDGTPEHAAFINAMDRAGNALLQLQSDGIPVLWRPFHEFDGGWFWWGKGGYDYFKRLWIMMHDHFTNDLGLNNLIWVLGYSHNGTDYGENLTNWYPGYQYVDIAGADSYEVAQNGACYARNGLNSDRNAASKRRLGILYDLAYKLFNRRKHARASQRNI